MYKKALLIALCVAGTLVGRAQVAMALQVPPTGVMQKPQLWNMALVYSGTAPVSVYISLTLLNASDNTPLMTATSRSIPLTRGTRQINATDVAPVQYNYLSSLFNIDRDPNGFLPIGNFKACYIVYLNGDSRSELAEDCIPVEVQPLSPPQLNLPADTATLEVAYPQFNWLPPTPLNLFSNLGYDMLVVEVSPGQSPYEAIQQNVPVYNISDYKSLVHVYPASNKGFDTGHVYAWRVIAKNEGQFVAQSEVWTFTIAPLKKQALTVASGNYILLNNSNGSAGVNSIVPGNLGIKYYSFDKAHTTTISFLDADGTVIQTITERLVYGDNFLAYPLDSRFEKGKVYTILITDLNNKPHTALFSISHTNN